MLSRTLTFTRILSAIGLLVASAATAKPAATDESRWTSLAAFGEVVQIYRDDYGAPHIFAHSNEAMFHAWGWVTAQDRLWQLELSVRSGLGTVAEILGSGSANADVVTRTNGYTDAQLDAQLATLSAADRANWAAYVAGINRYLNEVIALDLAGKLPWEFQKLGLGIPGPYTERGILAANIAALRGSGQEGAKEGDNKVILDALAARYGAAKGYALFRDVRWTHDANAPATIPDEAYGKRERAVDPRQLEPLDGDIVPFGEQMDEVADQRSALGLLGRGGSIAFVVSAAHSAAGRPMLFGGPQVGFSAPEVLMEVHLKSDEGYDVTGMIVPGGMVVSVGHNNRVAWTITTAGSNDNTDTFVETKCTAAQGAPGYVFRGECRPYEVRTEVVNVKGAAPRVFQVLRSVHGPVVSSTPTTNLTLQRSFWGQEIVQMNAFTALDTAQSLEEFKAGVTMFNLGWNVLYADTTGNIAYWMAGCNPLRTPGFDPMLPLPGDGSAEWIGGCRPVPESINPAQGWLANWNTPPTKDYEGGDQNSKGEIDRGAELINDVDAMVRSKGQLTEQDMRQIVRTVARVIHPIARESPWLLPYLLRALDAVPPRHPVAASARAVLQSWDGYLYADPVSSTTFQPGSVIFSTWLTRMLQDTFNDDFGSVASQATANTLLHALDFAFTGRAGVVPAIDYFNGVNPNAVMSLAFDKALASLAAAKGNDPSTWANPRALIVWSHALLGTVATALNGDRANYAQLVTLYHGAPASETSLTLGQSGFIGANADGSIAFDRHFSDQLENFKNMRYRPMPFYRNVQLKVPPAN
jgi:penicillin G amidase